MKFLTDFGDSAVLLPLSVVMLAWLLAARPTGAALWWSAAVIFCGGVTGALKIVFFACPPAVGINSPSGHTGLSLLVYGGFAAIVAAAQRTVWVRVAIMTAALGLAAAIAVSRVILSMHSTAETIIGFAIGGGALTIFILGYLRAGPSGRAILPLLGAFILAIAVFHGSRLNAEENLHLLSDWLGLRALFCR